MPLSFKIEIMRKFILFVILAPLFACSGESAQEVQEKDSRSLADLQLEFVNTRYQAYFHYNMCTFKNLNSEKHYGRSWGVEPVEMWAPTGLDCEQWAQVCLDAKMEGGWLTTKHTGGFCIWDSKYTTYDVASTSVKTDVVREFVDAFRAAGLKVGLYYSIMDYQKGIMNSVVTREGIDYIKNQITELLSNYGPIDYLNLDSWSTWPTCPNFDDINYGEIYAHVKSLQPECLIISHTYESNLAHADVPFADAAGRAYPYHPDYMRPSAASDILQRDWWWDDNNNMQTVKSVDYVISQLESYNSHNSVYILNVSPNSAGIIEEDAIERLKEIAAVWEKPADIEEVGDNWGHQYDVSQNLAFQKPCIQSTMHPYLRDIRAYPRPEIAVDGVSEGDWLMEQTSGTQKSDNPWWQVDLEEVFDIDEIIIYNATDSSKVFLTDFKVSILDNNRDEIWAVNIADSPNPSISIQTDGQEGRFIRIMLNGTNYLRIGEVIVKGKKTEG